MSYLLGQTLGVLGSVCCLIFPLFRHKWQMLVTNAAGNLLFAMNLVFIGQFGSAVILCCVGTVQALVSLWHVRFNKLVSKKESLVFLILYLVGGFSSLKGWIDLIPIGGAVFNLLATFQRDEQKTRVFVLFNALFYLVYFWLVGSTSVLAEIGIITTTILSFLKYQKKQ